MAISHRGRFWIAAAIPFLFLLLAVTILGCKDSPAEVAPDEKQSAEESPALPVCAEPAQRRTVAEWVHGLGNCEALPEKIATLAPAIGGQVLRILVEQGRTVRAGEPIVTLDPTLAQANLDEKKANRNGFAASLDAATVAVEKAEATVARLRPLRQRGEIPEQQTFEAELAVRQARLQHKVAQTQVATAEAAEASAKAQLDLHTIRAPIEGVLDSLSCRLGQTLAAGSAIGEIVEARQLHVVVWLPTADARRVRVGQPARISLGEVGSGQSHAAGADGEDLSGEVRFVGQVVDPQTGNLPIRILVDNSVGRLALGQTVAAVINVHQQADALVVPAQAVEDLGEGPLLNVIREGKSVVLHPRLGPKENGWVEVAGLKDGEDLKAGELVIVEGGYNLPEGTKVAVQPATETNTEGKTENKAETKREGKTESKEAPAGEAHPGAAP